MGYDLWGVSARMVERDEVKKIAESEYDELVEALREHGVSFEEFCIVCALDDEQGGDEALARLSDSVEGGDAELKRVFYEIKSKADVLSRAFEEVTGIEIDLYGLYNESEFGVIDSGFRALNFMIVNPKIKKEYLTLVDEQSCVMGG